MEIETKKAGMLTLQPVNQQALLDIILEMGGAEAVAQKEYAPQDAKAIGAANRMLTYCLGWGVVNAPSPDDLETLAALSKPIHLPEIARANWLRYLVLESDEASTLIAEVVKLTFGG